MIRFLQDVSQQKKHISKPHSTHKAPCLRGAADRGESTSQITHLCHVRVHKLLVNGSGDVVLLQDVLDQKQQKHNRGKHVFNSCVRLHLKAVWQCMTASKQHADVDIKSKLLCLCPFSLS